MLKPALHLKIGQQLTMTPQLQQAIKLLQLPILELQAQVQQALESNVMLEAEEDETVEVTSLEASAAEASEDENSPQEEEIVVEMEDPWADSVPTGGEGRAQDDDDRPLEFADERNLDLHQHLIWQLEISKLDPRELWIGEAIVDALNDDGYLTETTDAIARSLCVDLPVTQEDVERVLTFVQTLDPAGAGARDLAECLRLQLEQLDPQTPGLELALAIAAENLQEVADRDLGTLGRKFDADEETLHVALALIRGCNPRPGASFTTGQPEYLVPDVFVKRRDHGWSVEVNPAAMPRLRVNQTYASLVSRAADYATLRAQLQEARWLVRSLEIRHETLLKVARAIVQRQSSFLEQGEEAMQPMILRDIADAVSMHESTISRVTTGKYMHTPRGIFEFRYFFSSHVTGEDGEDVSSVAIRARIRRLISDEVPDKPYSDAQLAQVLAGEGVKVARRTVAKYREAMGLGSSSERRHASARAEA